MKIIGYLRVSTKEQADEGNSLAAQEERVLAYAKFVGADVVDVLVDTGSGRNPYRLKKREAVDRVLAGEADALVVYAIDRLSRSTVDFLKTIKKLRDVGRGFVSVREQLDTTTPHGRFALTILAAMAEMESELISARTKEGVRATRKRGTYVGTVPYGYRRGKDGGLEENPDEQAVILRIVALRDAGTSWHQIAQRISADGHRPRYAKWWGIKSVRTVYAQEMTRREERLDK